MMEEFGREIWGDTTEERGGEPPKAARGKREVLAGGRKEAEGEGTPIHLGWLGEPCYQVIGDIHLILIN